MTETNYRDKDFALWLCTDNTDSVHQAEDDFSLTPWHHGRDRDLC